MPLSRAHEATDLFRHLRSGEVPVRVVRHCNDWDMQDAPTAKADERLVAQGHCGCDTHWYWLFATTDQTASN